MKTDIILDLHGVVFENIRAEVFKRTLKKYGIFKTLKLAMCYKFHAFKNYFMKNTSDILYDASKEAKILPYALDVMREIINNPDIKVHVCSTGSFGKANKKLENFYRKRYPVLNEVDTYHIISPFENKKRVISDVAKKADGAVFVVDDRPENLKIAPELKINAVLISQEISDIKKAKSEYRASVYPNLKEFYGSLEHRR